MKKSILILVFLMIITMIVPVKGITMPQSKQLDTPITNDNNGKYIVSVKSNGGWKEIGDLSFGKSPSTQTIDVSFYVDPVIKLEQDGGGSAYLDVVLLDGKPAVKANEADGKLLNKLSKEDFDITPVGEEGVELQFSNIHKNSILTVVGRIEPIVIGKEPLQFPAANNYKSRDKVEDFYSYTLGSNIATINADGMLNEVSGMDPFVKEYRVNGSGHPEGDIYFWVMDDNENLYVTMDITSDNTFDGDKDYAKVYVNTQEGIKEYVVSVLENTWGTTEFTYTDKVAFEHKVYEFAIPLSEIGTDTKDINIAFVVYGTLQLELGYHKPALAYDPINDVYISVFEYVTSDINNPYIKYSHIYGELIDNKGVPIANSLTLIANKRINSDVKADYLATPDIAYGNNEFVVVWKEGDNNLICASTISIDENKIVTDKEPFNVSSFEEYYYRLNPKIAYDSIKKQYLVVWEESSGRNLILGKYINGDNTLFDLPFEIGDCDFSYPSICYSSSHECFVIVWRYDEDGVECIKARAVKDSAILSDIKDIAFVEDNEWFGNYIPPNVEINEKNDYFMVTYSKNDEIYGQCINVEITDTMNIEKSNDEFIISLNDNYYDSFPSSYYDGENMLCLWSSALGDGGCYAKLNYINNTGKIGNSFFTDGYKDESEDGLEDKRDIMQEDDEANLAITGNNKGNNLIGYELKGSNALGYRLIGNNTPEPPEIQTDIRCNNPDIAYDMNNEVYLSVFEHSKQIIDFDNSDSLDKYDIYGEFLDSKGNVISERFLVAEGSNDIENYSPAVSYDKLNKKFLVVWEKFDYSDDNSEILMASTVDYNNGHGEIVGTAFSISGNDHSNQEDRLYESEPDLEYSKNGEFLLVWAQHKNEHNHEVIHGRIINSNYTMETDSFTISDFAFDFDRNPSVSYNPELDVFMVAWEVDSNSSSSVEAKVINSSSNPEDSIILITEKDGFNPHVASNNSNNQFLITWEEYKAGGADESLVKGNYIKLNSELVPSIGSELLISPNTNEYNYGSASYDKGNGHMLCVWNSEIDFSENYAKLQYIDNEGNPIGESFYADKYENERDNIYGSNGIAISGDNEGSVIIAYDYEVQNIRAKSINNSSDNIIRDIGYRFFNSPISSEPSLTIKPNIIKKYVGEEFTVKVNYFDGFEDKDITDDVIITLDDPGLATSDSAIKGKFKCTAVGETILSTTHAGITATATLIVSEKTTPPPSPSVSNASTRIPIGQILVDKKVVKTLYEENVKVNNNTYVFAADKAGESAKLWLDSRFYDELAEDYPNRTIRFTWDKGTYTLPLNCHEVSKELDSSAKKVNILIEKVEDAKIIKSANESAKNMGAGIISDLIDFSVYIEKSKGTVEIESLDFYAERTINELDEIDEYISTAMKFVEDKEKLTFAPSLFDDEFTTIKYRGNGIFTIIKNPQTFNDIGSHWAKINIEKLATRNIAFGRQNNQFAPDDFITRAEFAVMITRALGITEEGGSNSFTDVSNEWFAEDISTAFDKGLINGRNDGKFYPNEKILRKDMAVMMYNALKFADKEIKITDINEMLSIFKDSNSIDDYARESVSVCVRTKIIMGRDTKDFDPNDNATRGEASAIIERMLKYLKFMD